MGAGRTGLLISISYSAHTSWPLGAGAEPAGEEVPGAAGAPGGRPEVPVAAAARHAVVEARALPRQARDAAVLRAEAVERAGAEAPGGRPEVPVAGAEPRAAFSAAVEAPASVQYWSASALLVPAWMVPTAPHRRLASWPFRARWSALLQPPARPAAFVQPRELKHSVSAP